jgi:exopolysaccharide biosynthesis WecB/TagA/CpsF family protein
MVEKTDPASTGRRIEFLGLPFDLIVQNEVLRDLRSVSVPTDPRYIVTPNVDHVVRVSQQPLLKKYYEDAWLSLCDSKPIFLIAKLSSKYLPHVTGSDLTETMFREIIQPGDTISVVAAYDRVVEKLSQRFPAVRFRSYVPPFGVLDNPDAQQAIVDFLTKEPARFIFIAIGSPQSEMIARQFSRRAGASGVAFCIGASLEFLVGTQRRAPRWVRFMALEWLFRLVSNPRRLWRRYLLSVGPLAGLYLKEFKASSRSPAKTGNR